MRNRIRITFRKDGDLRFISHRDLVRTLERLFRRTGFALSLSEGFHPKVRLSFPLALALGIEGACELMEVEFTEEPDMDELMLLLRRESPEGLEILSATSLPNGAPKARPDWVEYQIPIPRQLVPQLQQAITALMDREHVLIERRGESTPSTPEPR